MAVQLHATYAKKLGLPQYSSHQFTVSVQVDLTDLDKVPDECARLYGLLQDSVDNEIRHTGWLPSSYNGPHHANRSRANITPNGSEGTRNGSSDWNCSDKQRGLILKIVDENNLDRHQVDTLAQERFGKGVREINREHREALRKLARADAREVVKRFGEVGRRKFHIAA